MVITKNKRLLVHSQKENTFTTISNTNTLCGYDYMNSFAVFYSHSLSEKKYVPSLTQSKQNTYTQDKQQL